jgi:methylglutaconyl-CoA hydratase
MGGGLGIICVVDVAVAEQTARMALPEVRLGLAPSVISPFVLKRIGLSRSRQLALTGRSVDGFMAQEIGLVHDVAPEGQLDEVVSGYVRDILKGSPEALAATKALLFRVAEQVLDESRSYRVETLNRLRQSAEGQEGMASFVEKRPPAWVADEELY